MTTSHAYAGQVWGVDREASLFLGRPVLVSDAYLSCFLLPIVMLFRSKTRPANGSNTYRRSPPPPMYGDQAHAVVGTQNERFGLGLLTWHCSSFHPRRTGEIHRHSPTESRRRSRYRVRVGATREVIKIWLRWLVHSHVWCPPSGRHSQSN